MALALFLFFIILDYIVVFDDVARSFMQEIRSLVLDFLMNTSNLLLLLTPIT
jgi:hypothetical protein